MQVLSAKGKGNRVEGVLPTSLKSPWRQGLLESGHPMSMSGIWKPRQPGPNGSVKQSLDEFSDPAAEGSSLHNAVGANSRCYESVTIA